MRTLVQLSCMVIAALTLSIAFTTSQAALAQSEDDVIINEFAVNPSAASGKEYVELVVTKPGGVNMQGWTLSDVGTRAGSTSGTEGDITLPAAATYLSNVPQGTYVVIVASTPSGNTNTLTEDTSVSDGNKRLVLIVGTTAGLTTAGTFDIATAENLQLYAGTRAAGTLIDQVLAGNNTSLIAGATWGDNSSATTTDNINGGASMPSNSVARFVPTANTLAAFQDNDTGSRFVVDANSYGTPGNRNTGVSIDADQAAGSVLISEFRFRGPDPSSSPDPSGIATNEFVEIYNNTDSPITVSTTDGSSGWALAAADGAIRFTIPNGTVIPARGHYLGTNTGYTLNGYPAGNGTTATGDDDGTASPWTLDIPDESGIALFNTANTANFSLSTRLDAAGYTTALALYREGTGFPIDGAETFLGIEYSFVRRIKITPGVGAGLPFDTSDNAADFISVDTQGLGTGLDAHLGAPGPENLSSPIQRNAQIRATLLDPAAGAADPRNRFRDSTPNQPICGQAGCPLGTLSIRRTYTNMTGQPVSRLRFRIVDITTVPEGRGTGPEGNGIADLRGISRSGSFTVTRTDGSMVTVQGLTLEQPPDQPMGGGFNSSLAVTLAAPLAAADAVNVEFLLAIHQLGNFRFFVNVEAITETVFPTAQPAGRTSRQAIIQRR